MSEPVTQPVAASDPVADDDVSSRVGDAVRGPRAAFASGRTRSLTWRREQLHALIAMLTENSQAVVAAVHADLGKAPVEAHLTEVASVIDESKLMLRNLRRWTRDRPVRSPLTLGLGRAWVQRQPLGTVLVIGPWNYPLHLLLVPLAGALAAGNTAVIKPSELAPACSALLADLVPRYLDAQAVTVVQGGVPETTELLAQRFDHIFYTGGAAVGSLVMAAAARTLTPVTLELGGKSPVWVDDSVPVERVAAALAWGKFSNAGQTCVAPDYVLTTPQHAPVLADAVAAAVRDSYGPDPASSPDYGRIVNERHAHRLARLLGSGRAVCGGSADVERRYVAPTVLVDVDPASPVMQEEIFGPVLPVLAVADHRAAIEFINAREKPLALYAFTEREQVRRELLAWTSSGGVAFNAVMVQLGVSALPFGGVGTSGSGAYHGEHSVRTFSHERAVLRRRGGPDLTTLARPPYTPWKTKLLTRTSPSRSRAT